MSAVPGAAPRAEPWKPRGGERAPWAAVSGPVRRAAGVLAAGVWPPRVERAPQWRRLVPAFTGACGDRDVCVVGDPRAAASGSLGRGTTGPAVPAPPPWRLSLLCPPGWVTPVLSAGKPGWLQEAVGSWAVRSFRWGGRGWPQYPVLRSLRSHPSCAFFLPLESILAAVSAFFPTWLPLSARACRPLPRCSAGRAAGRAASCRTAFLQESVPLCAWSHRSSPQGSSRPHVLRRAPLLSGFVVPHVWHWPLPPSEPPLHPAEVKSHPCHRRRRPGAPKSTPFLLTFLPGVPSGPLAGGSAHILFWLCVDAAEWCGAVA
ncbi:uncharacterized protein LOC123929570 [Meles meles]|uniref:uncharacterized protein LOC123929570 n=1 Tax=Meles meles TaxID=9662 RepID=UPI001E69C63A|nr:uncharacterized protein LOC123929570 [Meles meles]